MKAHHNTITFVMILFHIITVLLYRKVVFLVSKCISFLYIDKIIVSTLLHGPGYSSRNYLICSGLFEKLDSS